MKSAQTFIFKEAFNISLEYKEKSLFSADVFSWKGLSHGIGLGLMLSWKRKNGFGLDLDDNYYKMY